MFGQGGGFRPLMGELRLKSVPAPAGLGQGPGTPAPSTPVPGPAGAVVAPVPPPVVPVIESGLSRSTQLLIGGGLILALLVTAFSMD